MKRIAIAVLQALVVLIGIAVLVFLLWEPHFEGRNVNATAFEVYFHDPFLTYVYAASIPFFASLYQAFRVLGLVGQGKAYSVESVKAMRTIKYCALLSVAFVVAGEVFFIVPQRGAEDIAGGIAMGLFAMAIFLVIAGISAAIERMLRRGLRTTPF